MPINAQQRHDLALKYIQTYFPDADIDQIAEIVDFAIDGFDANWSPIKSERDSSHGIGGGVSYEQFIIYLGHKNLHLEPIGVSSEKLDQIYLGVSM